MSKSAKPTGVAVETIHITDGKVYHVINKSDLDNYKGFKPVAKKTTKKKAKKAE